MPFFIAPKALLELVSFSFMRQKLDFLRKFVSPECENYTWSLCHCFQEKHIPLVITVPQCAVFVFGAAMVNRKTIFNRRICALTVIISEIGLKCQDLSFVSLVFDSRQFYCRYTCC